MVVWLSCMCQRACVAEINVSVVLAFLGPAGLSSDSGLGGSTDGSTDIVFGAVVDSVTEEGEFVCVSVCVCVCVNMRFIAESTE